MNEKKATHDDSGKIVKICVAGHPVSLSFAAEADPAVAQRIRNCLIDSYIRRNTAPKRDAA